MKLDKLCVKDMFEWCSTYREAIYNLSSLKEQAKRLGIEDEALVEYLDMEIWGSCVEIDHALADTFPSYFEGR